MVKHLHVFTALLLFILSTQLAAAFTLPPEPELKAKSWVLIDARSGKVLSEHNPDMELPPASLTKMLTLYLLFGDIKSGKLSLDEKVHVSKKAWKMGGSRMFIEPRLTPTVEELLHGISTLSGNDACVALAEHVDGSEGGFVSRMNEKARQLGMKHSHFVNATGYPAPNHYSSARDMAVLGAALWRDFPELYKLFSEREFTYNGITQSNRNRLLWSDPRVDGIKTGHTKDAGYCLVSSAQEGDTRFVAAIFGTHSESAREKQSRQLLNYGFRNFVTIRPAEKDIRREVEVFQGSESKVWLVPESPVWITVPKGLEKKVAFHLQYDAPLLAPIHQGQQVGVIEAVLMQQNQPGEVLASIRMMASKTVEKASWIGRMWDSLRLWWRNWNSSG
jgi:D-alanyl-D-alanine carboxypeptidase (penicillin-binding protein 5/6)